MLGNCAVL